MAHPLKTLATAAALLLGGALWAQEPEPATLALEVRASFPEAGLSAAEGGGQAPGLGLSLVMENDLVEHFEGWRARFAVGGDLWFWGNVSKVPGANGKVTAMHATGELVRMLRPGGDPVSLGPYVLVGLGLYEWTWTKQDPVQGPVDERVGHGTGIVGFGWRLTKTTDAELKVLMGQMDATTTAVALMGSLSWRF
ncbi:MAG: hypothetical protein P4L11_07815 [Geothrix sp.]|nr:hypothetical protein [Geothrix sp.]